MRPQILHAAAGRFTGSQETITGLLARKSPGPNTSADFVYQFAVRDISEGVARSALKLVESIELIDARLAELQGEGIANIAPRDVGRLHLGAGRFDTTTAPAAQQMRYRRY